MATVHEAGLRQLIGLDPCFPEVQLDPTERARHHPAPTPMHLIAQRYEAVASASKGALITITLCTYTADCFLAPPHLMGGTPSQGVGALSIEQEQRRQAVLASVFGVYSLFGTSCLR